MQIPATKTPVTIIFTIFILSIQFSAQQSQAPSGPTPATPSVFVFIQRAHSHVKFSKSDVLHEVVDDMLGYMKTKSISRAVDEFAGKSNSEDETPLSTVQNIAHDSGATYLLYVSVERPVTEWIKVTLTRYDMAGKKLWEEETSSGGGLSGGHGLRVTLDRLHEKLDKRLGQTGLPVNSVAEKPVTATSAQQ